MNCRAHLHTIALLLGVVLALSATAEEHKAAAPAATAAAAPKEETPAAPAKVALKTEAPSKVALKTEALAAAAVASKVAANVATKQSELLAAIDRTKLAVPTPPAVPRHQRVKVSKNSGLQHVALTSAGAKPDAHGALATTPEGAAAPHRHWSYEGATGPQAWARLSPEFAKCGNGDRQSPIDIRDGIKVELDPILFEYRPSGFRVVDNGHTIQANVNGWNSIRIMGRRYRLVQFHFHSPSEEMIDGQQFDMVVHLVHKDGEGRLAVVAVLVEAGARQPALQAVLNNLPLEKNTEVTAASNLDLNQILPDSRKYFTYMGSLTTPPCTEDVLWIVMKQPVQATAEQLNLFSRMYPMNARPVQSAKGRTIKESN